MNFLKKKKKSWLVRDSKKSMCERRIWIGGRMERERECEIERLGGHGCERESEIRGCSIYSTTCTTCLVRLTDIIVVSINIKKKNYSMIT